MPPKKHPEHAKRKLEIAAKVKEIKNRQQKWMDDKRQHDTMSPERASVSHSSPATQTSGPLCSPERNKVEKWLTHSHDSSSAEEYYTDQDDQQTGNDNTLTERFDEMADRIITRVKSNISHSSSPTHKQSPSSSSPSHHKQSTTKNYHSDMSPAAAITGHMCSRCNNIMVDPAHSPMMLIPCGHNLCEKCTDQTSTCSSCHVHFTSVTSNIMLKQIIINAQNSGAKTKSEYSPTAYKHKDNDRDYEQEKQSLRLRYEAMEQEMSSIQSKIRGIHRKIQGERSQIDAIEKKEEDILSQIDALHQRRQALLNHKTEFTNKIVDHKEKIVVEEKKVKLIGETMQYLTTMIENISIS